MWEVISTEDTMGRGTDGNVTKGVNATLRLDGGGTTVAFVPESTLLAGEAQVRAVLDARATAVTQLKGMQG